MLDTHLQKRTLATPSRAGNEVKLTLHEFELWDTQTEVTNRGEILPIFVILRNPSENTIVDTDGALITRLQLQRTGDRSGLVGELVKELGLKGGTCQVLYDEQPH